MFKNLIDIKFYILLDTWIKILTLKLNLHWDFGAPCMWIWNIRNIRSRSKWGLKCTPNFLGGIETNSKGRIRRGRAGLGGCPRRPKNSHVLLLYIVQVTIICIHKDNQPFNIHILLCIIYYLFIFFLKGVLCISSSQENPFHIPTAHCNYFNRIMGPTL